MLEQLSGWRVFQIHEVLDASECMEWIERAEDDGFDTAPIYTERGERIAPHLRDCFEITLFDTDAAALLTARIADIIASSPLADAFVGVHERLRVCRYDPGQKFVPHTDAPIENDAGDAESQLTLLVYLNDDFEGGQTHFVDNWSEPLFSVDPTEGTALLFEHDAMHAGGAVVSGTKYILRADVLFS